MARSPVAAAGHGYLDGAQGRTYFDGLRHAGPGSRGPLRPRTDAGRPTVSGVKAWARLRWHDRPWPRRATATSMVRKAARTSVSDTTELVVVGRCAHGRTNNARRCAGEEAARLRWHDRPWPRRATATSMVRKAARTSASDTTERSCSRTASPRLEPADVRLPALGGREELRDPADDSAPGLPRPRAATPARRPHGCALQGRVYGSHPQQQGTRHGRRRGHRYLTRGSVQQHARRQRTVRAMRLTP